MTSPASAASPAPSARLRWLCILAWLLLSVYFLTPPREAFDQSLDKSNYATYSHFLSHSLQWGTDVIPMTGPFGFILYGHTYSGELFGLRIAGDLLLKAAFSILLLQLFLRAGSGLFRWLWLAAIILLVPRVDDLLHDFAILLATLVLLARRDRRLDWLSVLSVLTLGALSWFKGTQLLTAGLCFTSVLLLCGIERRWRTAAALAAAYIVSLLGFWLLARQNPLHLPAYIKGVLELSSGYNATMGLAEAPFTRSVGLALAGGIGLVFLLGASGIYRSVPRMLGVLLLVGFSFIKWKHGFLRADGHVGIFFTTVPVILLTFYLVGFTPLLSALPTVISRWRRLTTGLLVLLVGGAAIAVSVGFDRWQARWILAAAPERLVANYRFLARPGTIRAELDRALERNRADVPVPQIANEVHQDSVDFFGYEEGVLLLHGFNYRPRPMGGGSFNVFTPWLQERNEAFVRDPRRAPRWQLLKLQTLDGRLPSTDDPLTLRAITELYSPVLIQRDYLLLKRRENPPPTPAPRLLETRCIRLGGCIAPPDPGPGNLLLFTLDAPLALAGRLRGALYRPPQMTARIVTRDRPEGLEFAIKPILAQRPAVLSPLLVDNRDVLQLFSDKPGDPVRTLTLTTEPGFATERLSLSFFAVPRPPPPEGTDIEEILASRQYPLYNRTPVEFVTAEVGVRELNKEPVSFVHAPGAMTWALAPGDQQVLFSYGLMPNAYLNGGSTDGVEFQVEVAWPDGEGSLLFRHMLRPCTEPADRGMHRARVFLPPYRDGARLRIRTDSGPYKNGAYDQAFLTRVQIRQGPTIPAKVTVLGPAGPAPAIGSLRPPLAPEQYNGLGVVPADGNLPKQAIAAIAGRPVFLIHATSEVVVVVPPEAHELTCEIGLLPGAYEGDGHTDGVNFTISLLGHEWSRKILLQRFVDPRNRPEDRGPQLVRLSLPAEAAGVPLAIMADPGPRGDTSWDHSYVAGVSFR